MTTSWIHRINIIAPEADKEALNSIWTVIAPEGDSESKTFGVPLRQTGHSVQTHRGVSTAATEEMRLMITEILKEELSNCVIEVMPHYINTWDEFLTSNSMNTIEVEDV